MDSNKKKILDKALYGNYEEFEGERGKTYANLQNSFALDRYMQTGKSNGFTHTNGIRAGIEDNFTPEELAEYFSEYLYDMAVNDVAETETTKEIFFKIGMQEMFGAKKEDIIGNISECLIGKNDEAYGFTSREMMDTVFREYRKKEFPAIEQAKHEFEKGIEKGVNPKFGVKKVNVNTPAINYCREEVLLGTQISLQNDIKARDPEKRPRREYNMDDVMMAVTDIGNSRKEQQDSVVVLYHPSSQDYKMLVVADGMGGSDKGQLASSKLVRDMTSWFEGLDPEYLKEANKRKLADMWNEKLLEINEEIIKEHPGSGSTFVGAIVGEKSTVVASVGDSRAYLLDNNNELYQITSDDNVQFKHWEEEWKDDDFVGPIEKDLLRFHKESNQITAAFGFARMPDPPIHFKYFKNSVYKTLMLFSDGVTDCLSDKQIMSITKNTKPKDLAAALVDTALTKDSIKPSLNNSPDYVHRIPAGKDNATAVVYDNSQEEER